MHNVSYVGMAHLKSDEVNIIKSYSAFGMYVENTFAKNKFLRETLPRELNIFRKLIPNCNVRE